MDMIDKYLEVIYLQEDLVTINELDLKGFISKLSPESKTKSLAKKISGMVNPKKPIGSLKKVSAAVKFLPTIKKSSFDKYMVSKVDNYKVLKNKSEVIVRNSLPSVSKDAVDMASTFLAVSTMFVPKKDKNITKDKLLKRNVQTFVTKVRKFGDDYEDQERKESALKKEDIPDLAVAWVIVVMSLAIGVAVYSGLVLTFGALASFLPWVMLVIAIAWVARLIRV
jgi:hypothetical protein